MGKDLPGRPTRRVRFTRALLSAQRRNLRLVAVSSALALATSLFALAPGVSTVQAALASRADTASQSAPAASVNPVASAKSVLHSAAVRPDDSLSPARTLTPAQAADPDSCANPIVCENELPGTPKSVWDVSSGEGTTIQGFADPFSVNVGNSISFKIESPATSFVIDIYRMGYYGGDGARLITSLTPNISVSQNQPSCDTDSATGLVDCGSWGVSATWNVPATAVSGVYFAHIYRTDGVSDENQIPFVVTNDASTSDVVMMTNDETWQAYNDWGGYSLYSGSAGDSAGSQLDPGRAVEVSYNRPFATRFDSIDPDGRTFFFADEFPMIEFLEENGYNVSYVSQADVSAPGAASMLEQHKVFLTAGHSEYWDVGARSNVTAARDAGVNLAFFAGNLMWWETRWAPDSNGENYRTLITYKESLDSAQTDPDDPPDWTGNWRDPRFSPPAGGGQPENALTGQLWMVNCCSYSDQVPYAYSKLNIWKNTAVAELQPGQTYSMPPETLGYEWDEPVDNGFQPAGEIDLSQTCEDVSQLLLDIRSDVGPGEACNSMTLYKAAGGALVFDAGTVQWAWGLNSNHDGDSNNPPDPVMEQVTVNILADMGAQPATLMSGLVSATAPDYTAPPSSTITSPSAGATLTNGSTVTISGTATDAGGGVVAGVEVSTDGGSTWHPVTTMSPANTSVTWSYTWPVAGNGQVTILSRATDDDGNTEAPGPGVTATVNCPCGLFGANYVPSVTSANDPTPAELGVKFQSSVTGWVAGVRFYKGAGNDGTHTGSLWTASGTLLATGTFTDETSSGWQSMLFANPVQISPDTTYVVSYYDPDGDYAFDGDLFDWQLNTPPLTALKSDYIDAGGGNGVYNAGGPGFPTSSYNGSSYAVDVIFDTTEPAGAPPSVTSVTPTPGSTANPVSTAPTATFSKAVVPSSVSFTVTGTGGSSVAGTTTLDSTDTVATFTPTSPLAPDTTYTVTISGAHDSLGQAMTPYDYRFTTAEASSGQCPCSIWQDGTPSGAVDADDPSPNNIGVEFQASTNGTISGVRFYKESDDTGTHTGTLWSSNGTVLATGTFTNESSAGWQELDFSTPVSVTAGATYVASYNTQTGHYAYTTGGLSSAVTNGPLTALAGGGVYAYGSANTFPTNTYQDDNFWVDVVFESSSPSAPSVNSVTPVNGSTSNPVSTAPTATFSEAVVPSSVSFSVTDSSGNSVAGTTTFSSNDMVATFTPSSSLAAGATYTAKISGAQDSSGDTMSSPYTWTFTTAEASSGQCPCSIWSDSTQPSLASANDPNPNNLGVEFTSGENGWITGIRFYKGSGNTGTHIGSLWDANGDLLGQVTFTNESTEGWQQANFSTPIAVTAGTQYVASYFAPNGDYAFTAEGLASAVTNGPLTALAGGGVYAYGSSTTFPTDTYENSNLWVDVVFTTTAP
jgi:methionine-rich copper-binding protein CopC